MPKNSGAVVKGYQQIRPGEGVVLEVVRQQSPRPTGGVITAQVNLAAAPVPERRYVSDAVSILDDDGDSVRMLFGQRRSVGSGLRSMLVIHMGFEGVTHFVASLAEVQNSTMGLATPAPKVVAKPLAVFHEEPEQTVALAANMIAMAQSGTEACLDFYYASAFTMMSMLNGGKFAVDPVVRVTLSAAYTVAIVAKMREMAAKQEAEKEVKP